MLVGSRRCGSFGAFSATNASLAGIAEALASIPDSDNGEPIVQDGGGSQLTGRSNGARLKGYDIISSLQRWN
jgi:hypothetical protein